MSFNTVRIVSDGTPCGTSILTKGGEEIPCRSVHFTHNGEEAPYVHLVLEGVPVDLTAHVDADTMASQHRDAFKHPTLKRLDVV